MEKRKVFFPPFLQSMAYAGYASSSPVYCTYAESGRSKAYEEASLQTSAWRATSVSGENILHLDVVAL